MRFLYRLRLFCVVEPVSFRFSDDFALLFFVALLLLSAFYILKNVVETREFPSKCRE